MTAELNFPVSAVEKLTAQSDVIVTCTPAKKAFLMAEAVGPGTFIAAVGCDSPDKQELDPLLIAQSTVFADLVDQVIHVADTHHAISARLITRDHISGELGEVISGRKPGRNRRDETIVFDSTGTALQDVAAASMIYSAARRSGAGTFIDLAS
jgi:ornithine cyclodeaminase/alanine dehydrogenase